LHTAARLGVFDALAAGPQTAEQLAAAVGAHGPSLRRLLRALTTVDVLREDAAGAFANADLGELLRADHPQSLGAQAIMYGEPFFWGTWGDLYETVRTGAPAFERVNGAALFDYLGRRPAEAALFEAGMTSVSKLRLPAILGAYDFSGFTQIVDVGGGRGALLRALLEHYPRLSGILYDQPAVIANAAELQSASAAGRCQLVGGNFFQSVPAGGDGYILKQVLHDWNDAEVVQILRHCRQAMAASGKLLVIETVLKPSNEPDYGKWADLNMLVMLSGRERTAEEFRALYAAAGFELTAVITAGGLAVVEGIPA
jgi:hypothetical protein